MLPRLSEDQGDGCCLKICFWCPFKANQNAGVCSVVSLNHEYTLCRLRLSIMVQESFDLDTNSSCQTKHCKWLAWKTTLKGETIQSMHCLKWNNGQVQWMCFDQRWCRQVWGDVKWCEILWQHLRWFDIIWSSLRRSCIEWESMTWEAFDSPHFCFAWAKTLNSKIQLMMI